MILEYKFLSTSASVKSFKVWVVLGLIITGSNPMLSSSFFIILHNCNSTVLIQNAAFTATPKKEKSLSSSSASPKD